MMLHIKIGDYEFVEVEVEDSAPLAKLLEIYNKLHDFPIKSPEARLKQRPKDELLDSLSAI